MPRPRVQPVDEDLSFFYSHPYSLLRKLRLPPIITTDLSLTLLQNESGAARPDLAALPLPRPTQTQRGKVDQLQRSVASDEQEMLDQPNWIEQCYITHSLQAAEEMQPNSSSSGAASSSKPPPPSHGHLSISAPEFTPSSFGLSDVYPVVHTSGASTPTHSTRSGLSTPMDSEPPSSGMSTPSMAPGVLFEAIYSSPSHLGPQEETLQCGSCGICSECDTVLESGKAVLQSFYLYTDSS